MDSKRRINRKYVLNFDRFNTLANRLVLFGFSRFSDMCVSDVRVVVTRINQYGFILTPVHRRLLDVPQTGRPIIHVTRGGGNVPEINALCEITTTTSRSPNSAFRTVSFRPPPFVQGRPNPGSYHGAFVGRFY